MQVFLKKDGEADRIVTGHEGQTILNLLANQGIHIDAPCAGRGSCGKCRVKVNGELSPADEKESKLLGDNPEERLACQARFMGEATIELAAEAIFSSVKGLGESEPYDLDSPLKMVPLEPLERQDNTDMLTAHKIGKASFKAMNQMAALDAKHLPGRAFMWDDELLSVQPGQEALGYGELLAAAVDLGTTGLSVAIIDLAKGEVVAQGTTLNPQTTCGGDVITRITYANEGPEQLLHLQKLIVDGIGKLIASTAGTKVSNIMAVAVSGNTTMMYLLAGIYPGGLAQSPYRPVCIKSLDLSHLAPDLGLDLDKNAKIFTAPCISAYVGGDITAGMLAVGLKKKPGTVLYIDIGTNGEIVLSHEGRLISTSCAAGPALEGMNILCGQRATPGAVDSFNMTSDYKYRYTTIGEAPPIGICGSGLIDITAALINAGLIQASGRLKPPLKIPKDSPWLEELKEGRFTFADKVYFDQKDIRQVQLAKGAIAAAVKMMLDTKGLTEKDLDEIIIAGAFGFHLQPESLRTISLIPKNYEGPVRFVGNSSLAGAARMLLTPAAIDDLNALAAETEVLELGFDPKFQDVFLEYLAF